MTEKEAREKWCPMYRFVDTEYAATDNRPLPFDEKSTGCCIASDCAAWREQWYETNDEDCGTRQSTGHGYCGLAGTP